MLSSGNHFEAQTLHMAYLAQNVVKSNHVEYHSSMQMQLFLAVAVEHLDSYSPICHTTLLVTA